METKKIYLDCTHTYNSGLNTGIQRVVKNIVKNSIKISRELNLEIIPVILINKNYYTFDKFLNLNENIPLNISLKIFLKKFYKNLKGLLKIITFNKSDYLFESPKLTIFLNEITDNFLFRVDNQINKKIEFQENETLVLLDSFWYNNYQKLIILKAKKVRIVNITYDLIPILYPQFCDEHLSKAFKLWYENNSNYMDKFVCISNSVKEDTYNYIIKDIDKNVSKEKFDYFYLGADFENNNFNTNKIKLNYKKLFETNNVFITVSTIEPRKNHEYILNAFEKLWEKNIDVKYIIIGRIGWKVESFIQRVQNHKEFKKRLFMLNNIDDELLLYAYKNSKALIFASFAEGFGLPIIESLYNKLQVLASNIEIHREIGKDKVSYFDLDDTNSLVELIQKDDFNKNIDDFKWISWEESTKQLINKVLEVK